MYKNVEKKIIFLSQFAVIFPWQVLSILNILFVLPAFLRNILNLVELAWRQAKFHFLYPFLFLPNHSNLVPWDDKENELHSSFVFRKLSIHETIEISFNAPVIVDDWYTIYLSNIDLHHQVDERPDLVQRWWALVFVVDCEAYLCLMVMFQRPHLQHFSTWEFLPSGMTRCLIFEIHETVGNQFGNSKDAFNGKIAGVFGLFWSEENARNGSKVFEHVLAIMNNYTDEKTFWINNRFSTINLNLIWSLRFLLNGIVLIRFWEHLVC